MSKSVPHLFICFSSRDQAVAHEVVGFLEAHGLKCWISSRDVPPGQNYQETIVQALEAAHGIVFLFSESSNQSGEIKKELSIGASIDTPVFPLRLAPVMPTGALRYELATRQWVDLFPDREQALHKLEGTIRSFLHAPRSAHAAKPDAPAAVERPPTMPVAHAPGRAERPMLLAPASAEFEAIRVLLARHIGPIAKVLLQKTTAEARTPDDLCERLALHVSAPSDRAVFLREARTVLANKS